MKFLGSIALCVAIMFGIVFAQTGGRQGTEIRTGGGPGGGGVTGQYVFNGPFTVQNVTNVFLRDAISNIFTAPITNLNDDQFATEFTIANVKKGALLTNTVNRNLTNYYNDTHREPFWTIVDIDREALVDTNGNRFVTHRYDAKITYYGDILLDWTNHMFIFPDAGNAGAFFTLNFGEVTAWKFGNTELWDINNNVLMRQKANGQLELSNVVVRPGTGGFPTNALVRFGAGGILETTRLDAATMAMSADGTLSSTVVGGAGGTNFDKALVNGIIYSVTNAGNNTIVTADWNGPHWMRLQFNGATTISFTNCPVASPTNGQIYTLELYAPSTVPTVTIQNIDARVINWQGVGSPVLIDALTNILTVRFDGTNFIGQSHQDRTIGTITSPYQLAYHSVSSNQNNKGVLTLTNQPGDGSPELRLRQTNGTAYTEITTPDAWLPTNQIVLSLTNIAVGEVLKVQAVSISGGIATIILTNGLDTGGSGSPGGAQNSIQVNQPNGTFYGTNTSTQVFAYDSTNGNVLIGAGQPAIRVGGSTFGSFTNIISSDFIGSGGQGIVLAPRVTASFLINVDTNRLYPGGNDMIDLGSTNNPWRSLYINRGIIYTQKLIESDRTLTNLDLSLGFLWAENTNHVVDSMYAITNPIPGEFVFHFLGRTNSAANQILIFTNAPGVTLNWVGSSTNGPATLTLYSNSFLKVFGSVSTNSVATNVFITWLSDSIWPQRNQAIIASAGGSTSNLTVGGRIYYDSQKYTNHSNGQNVTNYAFFMSPANILTNDGDMMVGEWDIMHQSGTPGTNQFFIGFGANTNLFNTGSMTNIANGSAKLRCEITRTGNSSQHIFCSYSTFVNNNVVIRISTNAEIAETCGITNILRMHGRKAGVNTPGNVGNHTNNQFQVWYHPAPRG